MKRFIYMDTQKMASYLAQANGGQDVARKVEVSDGTSSTTREPADSVTGCVSGGVSIPFVKGGLELSGTLHGIETAFSETQSGKEIVEKVVHDSIYNQLISKLSDDDVLSDFPIAGRYWCGSSNIRYTDFDWLQRVTDVYEDLAKSNYEQEKKEGQKNGKYPKYKRIMPDNAAQIFAMIKACFPSNVLVMNDNIVAFLRPEYIRESAQSIYLFRREMYMLGFCMRKYEPTKGDGSLNDLFSDMVDKALHAMKSFGLKTDDLTIVDPIAIYYDEESL